MKKSIIKVGIFVFIVIIIIIIDAVLSINDFNNSVDEAVLVETLSENSIIEFSGDKVIVTDVYKINVDTTVEDETHRYDLKLKLLEDMEYTPIITNIVYDGKENSIILEGNDLIDEGVRIEDSISVEYYYGDEYCYIDTNYLGIQEDGEHTVEITCEYDAEKVVGKYDDVCVIKLNSYADKTKIIFPKDVKQFKVKNPGMHVEKVNENVFELEQTWVSRVLGYSSDIVITLENSALKDGKLISGTFKHVYLYQYVTNNWAFLVLLFLTIISFISSYILTKKPRFENKYIRDTESLLDAVLSEALIDGRVGVKELIMTCVIGAIKKGAIEVLDNDTIRLISYDGLNRKEKEIVTLLFANSNGEMRFDDIKNIFIDDNVETKYFYETFLKIKNNILNELYRKNIYNPKGDMILKALRVISTILFLNIIPIMSQYTFNIFEYGRSFIYINIVTLVVAILSIVSEEKGRLLNTKDSSVFMKWIIYGILLISLIMTYLQVFIMLFEPFVLLITLLLFFINYKTYKNSKRHMLTKKGKSEYIKVLGLKKYIEDYSIMEKRDMEELILWDDYLVYATAFGIPTKITNRFAESLLTANINLQKINRIFRGVF